MRITGYPFQGSLRGFGDDMSITKSVYTSAKMIGGSEIVLEELLLDTQQILEFHIPLEK